MHIYGGFHKKTKGFHFSFTKLGISSDIHPTLEELERLLELLLNAKREHYEAIVASKLEEKE